MKKLKRFSDISTLVGIVAVILLILVFYCLNNSFLNAFNIRNLLVGVLRVVSAAK